MNTNKINKKRMPNLVSGFTLIELSVVLVIMIILISIIVPSFGKVGGSEALDTTTVSIISILNEAKSLAVSSKEAAKYGVKILNNKLISYKYPYGTNNKEYSISSLISVSTSTGIGTDIIFNNVTGNTSASGTITVTVLREPTKTSIIRIYSTGIIEKQ
jgi:prepilin-type N-terminal cleavage/methylation domain-containing protein